MRRQQPRDELPEGLREPLLKLWQSEQPIVIEMLPRDAWVSIAIVQFASRNPALLPEQRQMIESFGRELQRGITAIDPSLEPYIEMGWNPEFDVPIE